MVSRNKLADANITPITVDIYTLMYMLGVGRNTALKVANEAGANLHIGSRKLYNVERIKAYINMLTEEEGKY
jgi:ribosomal protein S13